MTTARVKTRPPRGEPRLPRLLAGDEVAAYLQDAARTPGGSTPCVALPTSEAEVAAVLAGAPSVLPVGAQSSLTGGATPFGAWVVSLARMDALGPLTEGAIRAQAGVALSSLEEFLAREGLFYPPVPTFRGALVGGVVSTNAAGAATFKYGPTRPWVRALTLVLSSGDVLDLVRGSCRAGPEGCFEIELVSGEVRRVVVPTYRMPDVPKRSAGYHAEAGMDLLDLVVGSEGTLGIVTEATLSVVPARDRALAWVPWPDEGRAIAAVARLRAVSRASRERLDVAAIEFLDRRCLDLLRDAGADEEHGMHLPHEVQAVLVVQVEMAPGADPTPHLEALGEVLEGHGALEPVEIALPGDHARAERVLALREAVPLAVNQRIADLQKAGVTGVKKTAADMIVPFEHLPRMMARYREAFERRGLDHALWGHVSDGNVHANAIPRSSQDVDLGEQAILELGREVIGLGGCPLSEHGVGRNKVKQTLLQELYGQAGIDEMRRVKAAFDPQGKLAPGVLFPSRE